MDDMTCLFCGEPAEDLGAFLAHLAVDHPEYDERADLLEVLNGA